MVHPEVFLIDSQTEPKLDTALTPFYPSVQGLNQKTLRRIAGQALKILKQGHIQSPGQLSKADMLSIVKPNIIEALEYLHKPPGNADTTSLEMHQHPFQKHLAFDRGQHFSKVVKIFAPQKSYPPTMISSHLTPAECPRTLAVPARSQDR